MKLTSIHSLFFTALQLNDSDQHYTGPCNNENNNQPKTMIVLDLRVDMVRTMLTPLTYEGLLDDVLLIDSGCIVEHLSYSMVSFSYPTQFYLTLFTHDYWDSIA